MKSYLASLLIVLTLVSCSKSNNNSNPKSNLPAGTVSGVLMDSPIGGVYYKTATFSGMTDDSGKYNCLSEEMVEFYLKGENGEEIALGEAGCSGVVSPIEIATNGRFNISQNYDDIPLSDRKAVLGMLRLFQSLNASANIDQGITISAADVSALASYFGSNSLTLDVAISELINSSNFEADFADAMSAVGKTVVSESDALEHFLANKENCNQSACTSPQNPPVVEDQPASDKCMQGTSYVQQTFTVNGLVNSSINPLGGTGEPIPNSGFLSQASTLIVLKTDHSVDIYRTKSGSTYYKYSAIWSINSSGRLEVDSINFPNGSFNWYFGAETDSSGIMTRIATPQTLGASDSDFQRTWRYLDGCYPPSASQVQVVSEL